MTDKQKRVEIFKEYKIAIRCETKAEAEKFIKWCYENNLEWPSSDYPEDLEESNYFNYKFGEQTSYAYNEHLEYSFAEYYQKLFGYYIIKYKDFIDNNFMIVPKEVRYKIEQRIEIDKEIKKWLEKQGLGPEFYFDSMTIVDKPRGKRQIDGTYNDVREGPCEDSSCGCYYWPLDNGKYIQIYYEYF